MRDVVIRQADPADLAALVASLGDEDFFTDRLARQQDGLGVLLTAWHAGDPIGGLYVWLEQADEQEVRDHLPGVPLLNHVEVRSDHRNSGVGTELVHSAERLLAGLGHQRVALAVRIDNTDAYRLYARLDYEIWNHPPVECMYEIRLPDGTRKRDFETCYMLVKELPGGSG
ncbi:GNAT family N-acetyltransferase [Actinocrispum wychmicini]|uniref:Ribosomal protein S18 acetylase RimI-like enzyme n=1 Tax=Actinocrispum wychmicini TaxID=1213861 RepID=A0A4R2J4F8_9PSEU|nr:GNAT family N-acetyltransferase [Actinocrispum wychmicini]TCO53563.1 ribosomal protein S18 acetylase RimI-like enzyme [Actinocrispum wychmicini]